MNAMITNNTPKFSFDSLKTDAIYEKILNDCAYQEIKLNPGENILETANFQCFQLLLYQPQIRRLLREGKAPNLLLKLTESRGNVDKVEFIKYMMDQSKTLGWNLDFSHAVTSDRETVLYLATKKGRLGSLKYLLNLGTFDVNARCTYQKKTFAMSLCGQASNLNIEKNEEHKKQYDETVNILSDKRINLKIRNYDEESMITILKQREKENPSCGKLIEQLKQLRGDKDAKWIETECLRFDFNNKLSSACKAGDHEMVAKVLNRPEYQDYIGKWLDARDKGFREPIVVGMVTSSVGSRKKMSKEEVAKAEEDNFKCFKLLMERSELSQKLRDRAWMFCFTSFKLKHVEYLVNCSVNDEIDWSIDFQMKQYRSDPYTNAFEYSVLHGHAEQLKILVDSKMYENEDIIQIISDCTRRYTNDGKRLPVLKLALKNSSNRLKSMGNIDIGQIRNSWGKNVMSSLIERRDFDTFNFLVKDKEFATDLKLSPNLLFDSARYSCPKIMKLLLEQNIYDINLQFEGYSALGVAIANVVYRYDHHSSTLECFKLLVSEYDKINVENCDFYGRSAVWLCSDASNSYGSQMLKFIKENANKLKITQEWIEKEIEKHKWFAKLYSKEKKHIDKQDLVQLEELIETKGGQFVADVINSRALLQNRRIEYGTVIESCIYKYGQSKYQGDDRIKYKFMNDDEKDKDIFDSVYFEYFKKLLSPTKKNGNKLNNCKIDINTRHCRSSNEKYDNDNLFSWCIRKEKYPFAKYLIEESFKHGDDGWRVNLYQKVGSESYDALMCICNRVGEESSDGLKIGQLLIDKMEIDNLSPYLIRCARSSYGCKKKENNDGNGDNEEKEEDCLNLKLFKMLLHCKHNSKLDLNYVLS